MTELTTNPETEVQRIRRVVTGHDAQGRSCIIEDEASPHVTSPFMGIAGFAVVDLWRNTSTPADNVAATDPCSLPLQIAPPTGGAVFRTTQFPPDKTYRSDAVIDTSHPHMHATQSLDYAIVLRGEIWLVTDTAETRLRNGDIVVQRGTRHAWANRSNAPCIVAFVMIDALARRS